MKNIDQKFVKKAKENIKKLIRLWFFGQELQHTAMDNIDLEKEIENQLKSQTINNPELPFFTEFLENLDRVNKVLISRIISANTASNIHGLSNQNITDWDRVGIVHADRPSERGKRLFSTIDIAWLYIIRLYQDRFRVQIKATSELLEPLLKDNLLRSCLLRDINEEHIPIAYIADDNTLNLSFTNSDVPSENETSLVDKIPIVPIMNRVINKASIPGFNTVVVGHKRYFNIEDELICLSDDFQKLIQTNDTVNDELSVVREILKMIFSKSPDLSSSIIDMERSGFNHVEVQNRYLHRFRFERR